MMETATTTAPTLPPSDLTVGKQVDIESRTWAGINKPGGHATITKIHTNEASSGSGVIVTKVDVKYVLGGIEKDVELTYIKAHVELARGGRRRRNDVKMNVDTLGGVPEKKKGATKKAAAKKNNGDASSSNKKRKALADVDGNNGKIKAAKKSSSGVDEEGVEERVAAVVVPVGGDDVDGKWTLIQDGKITDYTNTLQKGQRISYWWSDEDGWLPGYISKSLTRVVTASTIKWTIKVKFDNGDVHSLTFHPLEKRWKVFHSNKPAAALPEPTKKAAASKKMTSKATAAAGEKKDGKKVKADKKTKAEAKGEKGKAAKSSSSSAKYSAQTKSTTNQLSFGTNLQSKIKEISSKMHTARTNSTENRPGLSSPSMLAVKAAHAKSPMKSHSTKSIGYSASFPRGITKDIREEATTTIAATRPVPVSLVRPPSPKNSGSTDTTQVFKSQGSMAYAKSLKSSSTGGSSTVMQNMYKSECNKAENFVDYMTDPTNMGKVKKPPSLSIDDEGDLELKMNQERVNLFNATLAEILFKRRVDEMDVDAMVEKLNQQVKSSKPFTFLEVKPYLKSLDSQGKIMLVEDEGKNGVVYVV